MVRAPSPEEEDRRRLTRERGTLLKERIQHANRIRGLLSGHGIPGLDGLTFGSKHQRACTTPK